MAPMNPDSSSFQLACSAGGFQFFSADEQMRDYDRVNIVSD
jgi:hypothetical protein